jgi:diguanylate cyclase (GGDEF)-like protein/PAS domain S-box-containing protein
MPEDKDFFKDLVDHMYDGVYFVDRKRQITYWNEGAERITGYKRDQVIGLSCRDKILNHVTADGLELCGDHCPLAATMQDGAPREVDVFLHHADGHRVPVLVRAAPLRDASGRITGAVETFSSDTGDSSLRHELRELRRTTRIDPVTGVGSRQFLEGRLRALIAEYEGQESSAGLLFIDVDHFKEINDANSHEVGDKVLRMTASTLKHNLRRTDTLGRWGGDEFLVILYEVSPAGELRSIAEKLRALVERSRLDLGDRHLSITVSTGTTLLKAGDTPETLVRRADELMYQSKLAGRNRVTVGYDHATSV